MLLDVLRQKFSGIVRCLDWFLEILHCHIQVSNQVHLVLLFLSHFTYVVDQSDLYFIINMHFIFLQIANLLEHPEERLWPICISLKVEISIV